MVLRKANYKDKEKLLTTRNAQRKRYYKQTQGFAPRKWTEEEVELLLESDMSDRELSDFISRSVASIQLKRHRFIKQGGKA